METDKVNPASEVAGISLSAPTANDANHWRPEDLEELRACPICCSSERSILHHGVVDRVFFSSADSWNLWRCGNCECAYLSPRPSLSCIGRAYSSYYTHVPRAPTGPPNPLKAAYFFLRQVYERGQRGEPNSEPGTIRFAAFCTAMIFRRRWESRARLYPRRTGDRLLDVGCGSGDYLDTEASVGWKAEGIDPDPRAVEAGRARGRQIRLSDVESEAQHSSGAYDAITMSHVIEHFHDPIAALKACHSLLGPGGRIWIATPRLGCTGHKRFGENWRGLEVPRHLVLFDEKSLSRVLRSAGFSHPLARRVGRHVAPYWAQSYAISERRDPYLDLYPLSARLKVDAWFEDVRAYLSAHHGDQLIMTAERG
jgi:2-polyprenyl-3-methyl-5-hydroxy-6-metoxy-1,4-benzoquinol methylase